ncbi:DNA-3-methyladenine glycosylase I [Streptomyces sp. CB01881]|uniref:DNA-3-methyladenine glycosylase I n=1 Tax=Streptomyces sp. CB01881 TaxID=2078691 RepID=UPI000CDC2135|nr:DNA-3-methyladenine glycosylase I [Streptomyces sp. CB01881]AUY49954.1 DNA-3-methyladenine glycosylase I [Streptomyces sp. CB01881]TYC73352.1 DNA-3-methyladenine glycosylase I [Streptomyces sp. CB01881]
MSADGAPVGPDGLRRCAWGDSTDDYRVYHDTEWGRPVHGDDPLFERVCLEAFQSGLSWLTILRRREGFRAAFAGFEIAKVAEFGPADVERLLGDTGIIRNRAKIEAAVANARAALELDGGLDALIWQYAGDPDRPAPRTPDEVPAVTPESAALAKALKKAGFRFVGPTTAYALMQACGLVDDHLADCHVRQAVDGRRGAGEARKS